MRLRKYLFIAFVLIALVACLALLSENASATDAHLDYDGWEWWYTVGTENTLNRVIQTGATTEIIVPANLDGSTPLTTIAANCFNDAEGHKITKVLSMPATVTSIGADAFTSCTLMTACNVGIGVTSFGAEAFWKCSGLLSITIPNGVTSIGPWCFEHCTSLLSITIPNSVVTLGDTSFSWCNALVSAVIGNGVTSITVNLFDHSTSLTSIVLGNGITSIGNEAFKACTSLTSITFLGLVAPIAGADWILNCPAGIRGHAYAASNFPTPGNAFNGLTMGDTIDLVITSGAPPNSINEDTPYYYNATATQSGTWSISTSHSWISINSGTGKMTGTPTNLNVAVHDVHLSITNPNGTAYLNWSLTVVNIVVVCTSSPVITANQLTLYSYNTQSNDEGFGVTYSMTDNTSQLSINMTTGVVSGKIYKEGNMSINITIDDIWTIVWQEYTITVTKAISSASPSITDVEDQPYYYNATAIVSGTWSISTSHTWLAVGSGNGKVTGTPDNLDVATHTVSLRLTNSNGTAYLNWTLAVTNLGPLITSIPSLSDRYQGTSYMYNVQSTDEGSGAVYSMTCDADGLSINASTGLISGNLADYGYYHVYIIVNDTNGQFAYQNFTFWSVANIPMQLNALVPLMFLIVGMGCLAITLMAVLDASIKKGPRK